MRDAKTSPEELAKEERRTRVYELRMRHKSVRKIAKELGVSIATVHRDVCAVLDRIKAEGNESAEQHRALDVQRLDEMADALWARAEQGELEALDRYIKLQERRSKLLGLNAPDKVEHDHRLSGMSEDEIELAGIDELIAGEKTRELVRAALAKWDGEHGGSEAD